METTILINAQAAVSHASFQRWLGLEEKPNLLSGFDPQGNETETKEVYMRHTSANGDLPSAPCDQKKKETPLRRLA